MKVDHDVRVFDRAGAAPLGDPAFQNRVQWHDGDLTNDNDVHRALEGSEVLFHLVSTTLPKSLQCRSRVRC